MRNWRMNASSTRRRDGLSFVFCFFVFFLFFITVGQQYHMCISNVFVAGWFWASDFLFPFEIKTQILCCWFHTHSKSSIYPYIRNCRIFVRRPRTSRLNYASMTRMNVVIIFLGFWLSRTIWSIIRLVHKQIIFNYSR